MRSIHDIRHIVKLFYCFVFLNRKIALKISAQKTNCRIPPAGKMINAGCDCTQQGKQPEKAEKEKAQIDIILKKIFHPGRMQERTQQKSDCIWKKDDKRIWHELSHKYPLLSVGSGCGDYCRTCPFPRITYLYEVSSLSPMGPLA